MNFLLIDRENRQKLQITEEYKKLKRILLAFEIGF